jgi:hypothetical protein
MAMAFAQPTAANVQLVPPFVLRKIPPSGPDCAVA